MHFASDSDCGCAQPSLGVGAQLDRFGALLELPAYACDDVPRRAKLRGLIDALVRERQARWIEVTAMGRSLGVIPIGRQVLLVESLDEI